MSYNSKREKNRKMNNKVKLVTGILLCAGSFIMFALLVALGADLTHRNSFEAYLLLIMIFGIGAKDIIGVLTGGSIFDNSRINDVFNNTRVTEYSDEDEVETYTTYDNNQFREDNPYASYEASDANSNVHTYGHFKNGEKLPLHDARGNNICPACGKIYPMMAENCPDCGLPRQDREDNSKEIY